MVIAGGAGATALITALNSAKTVKSTKALLDNTKEMNKAFESGAMDSLNQVFQGIQNSGPTTAAMSVLAAKFAAGTMESQILLMQSLLDAFESEAGIKAIEKFNRFFSDLITTGSLLVDIANDLGNADFKGSLISFGQIMEKWAWLFGKEPIEGGDIYGTSLSPETITAPWIGGGGQYVW